MEMCHRSYPGQGQRLNLEGGPLAKSNEAAAFSQVPLLEAEVTPAAQQRRLAGDPSLGMGEGCLAVGLPLPAPGIINHLFS